ncbi:Glycosyl transferase family 2 [Pseudobutyrivibrio sp. UC1225]|uniref:glycosyltransferase family 2 protein n=1 Tax=Pseudobutyrivibrio sp. UC1225 TaxID=1798185 RepID=UPI0008EF1FDA|nr:glycosyltransferase [Pseudobutyrivibrio sp. UC1225]SFN78529.1 Glycosyl transferase family 2 [Pseudobutyrivibrio sp. UC1225]
MDNVSAIDQNELISVIMSAYNTPNDYLKLSIDSILSQTYKNIELLIVIDSPDNEEMIHFIEAEARKDDRVRLIYNEQNIGLPGSLNVALAEAKGKYIARMDTDDIAFCNRLEKQLECLESGVYDLVAAKIFLMDEEGNVISEEDKTCWTDRFLKRILQEVNCMPHPTWLGKKEVFDSLGGYKNIDACEDYEFLLRALAHGFRLGMCDTTCLKYRVNPNGISSTKALRQDLASYYLSRNRNTLEDNIKERIEYFLEKYLSPQAMDEYAKLEDSKKNKNRFIVDIVELVKIPGVHLLYAHRIKIKLLWLFSARG